MFCEFLSQEVILYWNVFCFLMDESILRYVYCIGIFTYNLYGLIIIYSNILECLFHSEHFVQQVVSAMYYAFVVDREIDSFFLLN
jgi:hypothetical protein